MSRGRTELVSDVASVRQTPSSRHIRFGRAWRSFGADHERARAHESSSSSPAMVATPIDTVADVGAHLACATDEGRLGRRGSRGRAPRTAPHLGHLRAPPHDEIGPACSTTISPSPAVCGTPTPFRRGATRRRRARGGGAGGPGRPPVALGRSSSGVTRSAISCRTPMATTARGGAHQRRRHCAGAADTQQGSRCSCAAIRLATSRSMTTWRFAVDADGCARCVRGLHARDERPTRLQGTTAVGRACMRCGSRGQGDGASAFAIAPGACGKDAGPFWTGTAGGRWCSPGAERVSRRSGLDERPDREDMLAFRVLGEKRGQVQRVAQPWPTAIVDASGCVGARCYAVALARAPRRRRGMRPAAARVITFP